MNGSFHSCSFPLPLYGEGSPVGSPIRSGSIDLGAGEVGIASGRYHECAAAGNGADGIHTDRSRWVGGHLDRDFGGVPAQSGQCHADGEDPETNDHGHLFLQGTGTPILPGHRQDGGGREAEARTDQKPAPDRGWCQMEPDGMVPGAGAASPHVGLLHHFIHCPKA